MMSIRFSFHSNLLFIHSFFVLVENSLSFSVCVSCSSWCVMLVLASHFWVQSQLEFLFFLISCVHARPHSRNLGAHGHRMNGGGKNMCKKWRHWWRLFFFCCFFFLFFNKVSQHANTNEAQGKKKHWKMRRGRGVTTEREGNDYITSDDDDMRRERGGNAGKQKVTKGESQKMHNVCVYISLVHSRSVHAKKGGKRARLASS